MRRSVQSEEDAEDILLEVFLAALENDGFLSLGADLQLAWLRRVAYNKVVDWQRRSYRRPQSLPGEHADLFAEDERLLPEEMALRNEEYQRLRDLLERLPPQQQEVVRLHFGVGMRCVDIARHLNQRESTVRTWLTRSLQTLRLLYAQRQEGRG